MSFEVEKVLEKKIVVLRGGDYYARPSPDPDKEKLREEIKEHMEAFEQNGGIVDKIGYGVSGINHDLDAFENRLQMKRAFGSLYDK